MAKKFDHWVGINENTRAHKSRTAAESYYSEIYACVDEPCPGVYQCDVPEALVEIEFGFIFAAGGILQESSLVHANLVSKKCLSSASCTRLAGRYISLIVPWATNHAHWLMDILPKLAAIRFHLEGRLLLVHPNTPDYQMDGYELLGIPRESILRAPQHSFAVEDLRVIRSATHPGKPHPILLSRLRERFETHAETPSPASNSGRFYISRHEATRDFLNAAEVQAELNSHGFTPVAPELLTFLEQVRLFAGAQVLIGAHGAGTMNILLAPKRCHLVEIFNPRVWDSAAARVAGSLGNPHWHLFSEPQDKGFETRVDLGWLRALLNCLEGHVV
jgi:capsular polysaccharide biosynthesis protein